MRPGVKATMIVVRNERERLKKVLARRYDEKTVRTEAVAEMILRAMVASGNLRLLIKSRVLIDL